MNRTLGWLVLLLVSSAAASTAPVAKDWLDAWLAHQATIQTWEADVLQTRRLKSLVHPLISTGHVWFASPDRFRWELGTPPQSSAIRDSNRLVIVHHKLKRLESFPLSSGKAAPQWRDALALLETGFPRDPATFRHQFEVLAIDHIEGAPVTLRLSPQAPGARRWMPEMTLGIEPQSHSLLWTEIRFADGSTLRNDFSKERINEPLNPLQFSPPGGEGWKIIHGGKP